MVLNSQLADIPLGGAKYINKHNNRVESAGIEVWAEGVCEVGRVTEGTGQICPRMGQEKSS